MLAKLAEHRRVIGIDLQGHGRTPLGDRKLSAVDIGRDLGTVVQKLGLRQVDAMGYSFGGLVALQFAIQNPTLVRKLVLVSTVYARNGMYPEILAQGPAVSAAMADQMEETPMYKNYLRSRRVRRNSHVCSMRSASRCGRTTTGPRT